MSRPPRLSSQVIVPANEAFDIHYTTFENGSTFERPANAWPHWSEQPYAAPASNPLLIDVTRKGVPLGRYEHVSLCTNGAAQYIFDTDRAPVVYEWAVGEHNVDGGFGYLPKLGFRRIFRDNFTLCCAISKPGRDWGRGYRFSVMTESGLLPSGASFVHVALGSISLSGARYDAGQTATAAPVGVTVSLDPGSTVIVCTDAPIP